MNKIVLIGVVGVVAAAALLFYSPLKGLASGIAKGAEDFASDVGLEQSDAQVISEESSGLDKRQHIVPKQPIELKGGENKGFEFEVSKDGKMPTLQGKISLESGDAVSYRIFQRGTAGSQILMGELRSGQTAIIDERLLKSELARTDGDSYVFGYWIMNQRDTAVKVSIELQAYYP